MRRFWHEVRVADGGIALDGKPVHTPGRAPLILPTPALAEAVAAEWRAVDEAVDPRHMPMTGLANAAIDRVAEDRPGFAAGLARYAGSDLLCYRAEEPPALTARQAAAWDPPLAWAQHRYDVHFVTTTGVMHRPQPAATLARLGEAVAALDAWRLAALSPLVTVTGSLVLALALAEGAIEPEAAWAAARVDEDWQAEQWGTDPLAQAATAAHRADYDAGVRMLALLEPISPGRG
jgi:chaperone required for assembly of F1-ATPase